MYQLIDGGGIHQLKDVIRQIGEAHAVCTIDYATVITPPPAISIQIDGMKIPLEEDDVSVPDYLREHVRTATFKSLPGASVKLNEYTRRSKVAETSSTDSSEMYEDEFDFAEGSFTGGEVELTIASPLQAGDRVVVAQFNRGQQFVLLGKL